MPKARRKPYTPTIPPAFVTAPAENAAYHARYTEAPGIAANGAKIVKRTRPHICEVMRQDGHLTSDQARVGVRLCELFEATQMQGADGLKEFVDRWPDWAAIALNGMDAKHKFVAVFRDVPLPARRIVWHVCCEDRAIGDGYARGRRIAAVRAVLRWALGEMVRLGH